MPSLSISSFFALSDGVLGSKLLLPPESGFFLSSVFESVGFTLSPGFGRGVPSGAVSMLLDPPPVVVVSEMVVDPPVVPYLLAN